MTRFLLFVLSYLVCFGGLATADLSLPFTGPDGETYLGLGNLHTFSFSEDESQIITVTTMGILHWDIQAGSLLETSYLFMDKFFSSIHSEDEHFLFVTSGNSAQIIDIQTQNVIHTFPDYITPAVSGAFNEDSTKVVIYYQDGNRIVWPIPNANSAVGDWMLQ